MKFFQRLNVCQKCGVGYEPKQVHMIGKDPSMQTNTKLCMAHFLEEQEEKSKNAKFKAWIEQNRPRLEAEMKAETEKNVAQSREKTNQDMQMRCQAFDLDSYMDWLLAPSAQRQYAGGFFS